MDSAINLVIRRGKPKQSCAYLKRNAIAIADNPSWHKKNLGIEHRAEDVITHETLHLVIFKLEGIYSCYFLDNISCWHYKSEREPRIMIAKMFYQY